MTGPAPRLKEAMASMKESMRIAHNEMRTSLLSPKSDPEVTFFKSLTPDEMTLLSQTFGDDQVASYVQAMKAKEQA